MEAGIFLSILMIISFFLQAAHTVLKETIFLDAAQRLKGGAVDLFVVNSYGSAYQFYQQEANKLCKQIRDIQGSKRQILGEGVSNMSLKDLRSTESKIQKAISRIRTKKNEMLFAEIELMHKRELELHNANMFLRAKIAEDERAQQQMTLMPSGSEYHAGPMSSHSYDVRNFLPMNLMEPNQQQ